MTAGVSAEPSHDTPHRGRMRRHLLGGDGACATDIEVLEKLGAIVPRLDVAAADVADYIDRALRWAILRQGIRQVLVVGDALPAHPSRSTVWHSAGALCKDIWVTCLVDGDDAVSTRLAVEERHQLPASLNVDVVTGDPAEPAGTRQVRDLLEHNRDPVVTVIPGLLPWLGDDRAATVLGELSLMSPPGSVVIAAHALDPGTDVGTAAARELAAVVGEGDGGPIYFRSRAQLAGLMPGNLTCTVGRALDWFPLGPECATGSSRPSSRPRSSHSDSCAVCHFCGIDGVW